MCAEFARLVGVIRDTNWGPVFNVENKAAFKNSRNQGVDEGLLLGKKKIFL